MYPNLYYAFKDLFGVDWKFLRFINSFGFFVAIAFILGAIVLANELRRKSKQGLLHPTEMEVVVGKPATAPELILNFLLGFLLGYKILALFILDSAATNDPQAFIFSTMGSWPTGIGLGLLFVGLKWWEKHKQKLPKPEQRKVRIWPQDRVGEITILALVFGLIGAKLFDIFENWSDFLKHPASYIFSPSGLTFYGGLICAAVAIALYNRKHKIPFWHFADAIAPALMIAYAIGRIGCHVSGDGDWGIFNSAFQADSKAHISPATPTDFGRNLANNTAYFTAHFKSPTEIPHWTLPKPRGLGFLPNWFFAYDYPHNVNESGVPLDGCTDEKYCNHLPVPVFPTSFYETLMCSVLFLVLWVLRKRLKLAGSLFALYLILNGLERFMIEKIRVNNKMEFLGMEITQAEIISSLLVITGIVMWIFLRKRAATQDKKTI